MKEVFLKKFGSETGNLRWFHWLIISLSLVLTFSAWYAVKKQTEEKTHLRFEREVEQVIALVKERMEKYEEALWAGVAAIHSQSHGIDYKEWKRFSEVLRVEERFPGINGIGVIHYVAPEKLNVYLLEQRKDRPDFAIHPKHDKNEFWPITYIEPVKINAKAVGLDMAHETNRHTAGQKARDTGLAQITGPITLVQDAQRTPGFLFYAPFYEGINSDTLEERRERFIGMVYAPFIMWKLMEGTLKKEKRHVGIKISDSGSVLYDEHLESEADFDPEPLYTTSPEVELYGRVWKFDIRAAKSFRSAAKSNQPLFILIGGLAIDTLLVLLFITLSKSNQRAIQLVQERGKDLEKSEITRKAYVDASGDGYWDWFIQDDYEYMSPGFWKMFGYKPEEKEHKPSEWQEIIFEKDLKAVLENFDTHITTKGKHPFSQEVRYHHKDGSTVHVICKGEVIEWDEGGKPVRMIGTHTDITALKKAKSSLKESQTFLQLIMSHNPDLVFVKDSEFRIVQANPAFLRMYPEKMQDKIIGYTTFENYDEVEAGQFLEMDKKAFVEGVSENLETINFPDGQVRTLLTKKTRFENGKGELFILGVARDVTEREELVQRLSMSNDELEKFAYVASHDLQEPLRMVRNFTELLEKKYGDKLDEQAQKYIHICSSSAERMQALVQDLLDYARISGEAEDYSDVECEKIVEYVMQNLEESIKESDAQITYDALPTIIANPIRISRVIQNLVGNAIKYQKKGSKPKIHISSKEQKTQWEFCIEDNGIGMDPEYCERIFLPFQRLHHKNEYSGTGIGLSICQKIIERMGGSIWVKSKLGKGSKFYFCIPKRSIKSSQITSGEAA